jgi:AraC-like DNA-binding protein
MEYIRLRRLASVHRSLSDPYRAPTSVTQAALNAGFTDLGRFSTYYRRLYGESPSLTRRRAAELSDPNPPPPSMRRPHRTAATHR